MVLHYAYGVPCERVGRIFGISGRTVLRWYQQLKSEGHVMPGKRAKKTRQPPHVQRFVADYVKVHPCFYVEELQTALRQRFGAGTSGFSASALLRLLKFDLGFSRKVLERRAREAVPREIEDFLAKMKCWYKYPEQLVFVDETSKNGLDSMRRYAWSARGERAVVRVPFSRGKRISILVACDVSGFLSWNCTRGTYTRMEFHRAFLRKVIPKLNPWPLPRSIVVIDNARIHMYAELETAVHACDAILLYLPPYCPQFNPIEVMFGQLKRWLARHANLAFPQFPELVLEVAMRACVKNEDVGVNLFRHCGYGDQGIEDSVFARDPW
ncbi:hypothetical protein PR002_g24628 [Phytophthora rubi]|uniref:Tc1-like transposase DDE domain-containing protein n=1 Tax=Phytophthora rubi TaxID=129364 RepID=A0A6A3IF53_9STRA|nr:hypothetical protein PR002_g24628 [Phytophthora rubi]